MIVFSDLDGTLLDSATYSFAAALPAIQALKRRHIPLVLVSSKTRVEMESLRAEMQIDSPFIVENGGAIIYRDGSKLEMGVPREEARDGLRKAARAANVKVRMFSDMSMTEIRDRSGLTVAAVAQASQREYGEPFVMLDPEHVPELVAELAKLGFRITRGGKFFHVLAGNDKAKAVQTVTERMGEIETVGLGDAMNDVGFLKVVSTPIIIPSPHLERMREELPHAQVAPAEGPAGWNAAVLGLLEST